MITKVKVSKTSVLAFRDAVNGSLDFSSQFDRGAICLSGLISYIDKRVPELKESIKRMITTTDLIREKSHEIDGIITELTAKKEKLQNELASVEAEIASTPKNLSETDDEGHEHQYRNPQYDSLCEEASELRSEIRSVQEEVREQHSRLEHTKSLLRQAMSHTNTLNSAINSLERMKSKTISLRTELGELKNLNIKRCSQASNLLLRIKEIIEQYLSITLQIQSNLSYHSDENISIDRLVNYSRSKSVVKPLVKAEARDNTDYDNQECTSQAERTDDKGHIYRIGDELVKDNTFTRNGYTFTTDNLGRTVSASGKLNLQKKERHMTDSICVIGKGDERDTDDRGHLVGHQFLGPDEMENLVPQDFNINHGTYRSLETKLAREIEMQHNVRVAVFPIYVAESRRPDGIFYFYDIDGISNIILFPNETWEV